MAITPVNSRYPGFIFAGENSRDYGVYITSPAVFNAPERDAEMVTIPGRNGDYVLDRGRWKNITVTYNCALPADTTADFIQGVEDFRNMLASKVGYQRLEDEINTAEYREGAFVSGLDVESLNTEAGTFAVVFTCKPQRFLVSGETAVDVEDGDTLTNPTDYESSPVLQVWQYGDISINGDTLSVTSVPMGLTQIGGNVMEPMTTTGDGLIPETFTTTSRTHDFRFSDYYGELLMPGDPVTFKNGAPSETLSQLQTWRLFEWTGTAYSNIAVSTLTPSGIVTGGQSGIEKTGGSTYVYARIGFSAEFTEGTPETKTGALGIRVAYRVNGSDGTALLSAQVSVDYDGDSSFTVTITGTSNKTVLYYCGFSGNIKESVVADSSVSALGTPLYIDLDIGEGYKIESGNVISSNAGITLPANLPTLKPGENAINYDNTITQLKIVPRWWRL